MSRATIAFVKEFELSAELKTALSELLITCFPEVHYKDKPYFKQLPHYRLITSLEGQLVAQVGIDYRVMSLNGTPVTVWGVIDLVVHPAQQRSGLGTQLMLELERIATANKNNIDFIFLVTDQPAFYERLGYRTTLPQVSWLKIHQGKNYGLGNQPITDSILMYKPVSGKNWEDGELDMLGYMY